MFIILDRSGGDRTGGNGVRQTDDAGGNTVGDVFHDTTAQRGAGCIAARDLALLRQTYRHQSGDVQRDIKNTYRVTHHLSIILIFSIISLLYRNYLIVIRISRWVLEAMKLYLQMFVKNTKPIENYSPYEVRQFLIKVLTVKEWANTEK